MFCLNLLIYTAVVFFCFGKGNGFHKLLNPKMPVCPCLELKSGNHTPYTLLETNISPKNHF